MSKSTKYQISSNKNDKLRTTNFFYMTRFKQFVIFSLSTLLFVSAVGILGTKLSKTYSNADRNFQVSYPSNWKVDENYSPDLICINGPVIDTLTKQTDGAITINTRINSKVITTTENYKAKIAYYQANCTQFKIIEEGELVLGEVKSKYVIHKSKVDSAFLTTVQFYFSNGKTSFILGGSVPGETLGKYKTLYFDIAKSIKFTKK